MSIKNCIPITKTVTLVILYIITWVIFSPGLIVLFLGIMGFILIRKCVDWVVLKNHPDWKRVTGPDAIFCACMDTYDICTVFDLGGANVKWTDAEIQNLVENIREKFKNKILQPESWPNDPFWKLRFAPVKKMLYYYWAPVNVDDLAEYIHIHVQGEGRKKITGDELNKYVIDSWLDSSYHGRSPWEILIVDTETGPVLCFRMRHAVGGFLSFRWILEAINGELNGKTGIPALFKPYPYTRMSLAKDLLMLPWNIVYNVRQIYRHDSFNLKPLSNTTVFANDHIQLSSVKKISKRYNCPVRNVLSATFGSALRRFELEGKSELDISKMATKIFVIHPWFYSSISSRQELNNELAAAYHTVSFDRSKPADCLRLTNDGIQRSLASTFDRFIYYSFSMGITLPNFVLEKMFVNPAPFPNACSDIPFTSQPQLYILGYPVKSAHLIPSIKQSNIGCLASFVTIGNEIGISIVADERRIPTNEAAKRLCQYFKEELGHLENSMYTE